VRVLLVGASGYVGQAIVGRLQREGCELAALARSDDAVARFQAAGVAPIRGDVLSVGTSTQGLRDFDACIWLSWLDWSEESTAVHSVLNSLFGRDKTFIFTSGTGMLGIPAPTGLWDERSFAEDDPFTPAPHLLVRAETEQFVRTCAGHGIRSMVIRPPLIWGKGGSRQIPLMFESVLKIGDACYIGAGLHVYSHVHVDDLADVYWRALRHGTAGALYHAVAGETDFRSIAEAVATVMGCGTRSLSFDEGVSLFGPQATRGMLAVNSRTRSPRARGELGWLPQHVDLIEDVRAGSYRARYAEADERKNGGARSAGSIWNA
jgi:nucleoside-diphosphate-sugar epimerase